MRFLLSGPYGVFAGRDASRGLAKMDLKSDSFGIDDLSPSEKHTLKEVSVRQRARATELVLDSHHAFFPSSIFRLVSVG